MVLGTLLKRCVRIVGSVLGFFRRSCVELHPASDTSSPTSSEPEPVVILPDIASLPWWERETSELPGSSIYPLGRQLQSDGNRRILCAYQRGRQAAEIKRGERGCFSGPRCELRNRC